MTTTDAYLLGGLRTPYGKLNGYLSQLDTVSLGASALAELHRRHPCASSADGALLAMVMQAGQGPNPARTVMYRSGIGSHIPSSTLNNACLAGVDTAVDAARRVERGEGHLYVVGGMDSATNAPEMSFGDGGVSRTALEQDSLTCAIEGMSMAQLSDRRNAELGIGREEQDEWAVRSHRRAAAADFVTTGEMMAVDTGAGRVTHDEGVRADSTLERIAKLAPLFAGGTITAANASQVSDGAAVGLVGSLQAADNFGLAPIARIAGWGYSAGPNGTLHDQPADATRNLLKNVGLDADDIDLFEINEAFAGVTIHAAHVLGISPERVNPNGGAIALGHPYGGTGLRLVLTLGLEMARRDQTRGVATLCGGGGQGISLLLDRTGLPH